MSNLYSWLTKLCADYNSEILMCLFLTGVALLFVALLEVLTSVKKDFQPIVKDDKTQ